MKLCVIWSFSLLYLIYCSSALIDAEIIIIIKTCSYSHKLFPSAWGFPEPFQSAHRAQISFSPVLFLNCTVNAVIGSPKSFSLIRKSHQQGESGCFSKRHDTIQSLEMLVSKNEIVRFLATLSFNFLVSSVCFCLCSSAFSEITFMVNDLP